MVRWRRIDLKHEIKKCFYVDMYERSVGKLLGALGIKQLFLCPQHPESGEAAQEAFEELRRRGRSGAARSSTRQGAGNLVSG